MPEKLANHQPLFGRGATWVRLLGALILLASFGCQSALQPPPTAIFETETTTPPAPTATFEVTPAPSGPATLRLWLPPQFDPATGTPAARLLQTRLDEFTSRRPDVRLEVRIKAVEGPGGLLDALTAASGAAHRALPDLVALPRSTLEAAAIKGLLHPLDGLTNAMDDPDWYDYARQLARVQNSVFGLPFAGDALLLAYRPAALQNPPVDFSAALSSTGTLVFPASDPAASYTLALYLAAGGAVQDEQGRPTLQEPALMSVLDFYQAAEKRGFIPFWTTQFTNDSEVWQAFMDQRADVAVVWSTLYLQQLVADAAVAPLLTPGPDPSTQATGWVWATASPVPEHLKLSVELAEFLSSSDFLATWTVAAGVLPPRPSALAAWQNTSLATAMDKIALDANLIPTADVLTILAPPLAEAAQSVLKGQKDPATAARDAVSSLTNP